MLKHNLVVFWFLLLSLMVASAGDIMFQAKVDRQQITDGSMLKYTLTISGLEANDSYHPQLPPLSGFKITNSTQSFSFSFSNGKGSATKTYVYSLKPLNSGTIKIGSALLKFNNVVYKTSPIEVVVSGVKSAKSSSIAYHAVSSKSIQNSVTHPSNNKSNANLEKLLAMADHKPKNISASNGPKVIIQYNKAEVKSFLWLVIIKKIEKNVYQFGLISAVFILAGYFVIRYRRFYNNDSRVKRLKNSRKIVDKRLKKARTILTVEHKEEFYSILFATVSDYLGYKYDIELTGLTQSRLMEILHNNHVSERILEVLKDLISTIDYARFAPSQITKVEMQEALAKTEKLIMEVDENV